MEARKEASVRKVARAGAMTAFLVLLLASCARTVGDPLANPTPQETQPGSGELSEEEEQALESADCEAPDDQQAPPQGMKDVKVYFPCYPDDPGTVRTLFRQVPANASELTAALEELLKGPTPAEKDHGFVSAFTQGAGKLRSASVDAFGNATIDFEDFSHQAPNAATTAGALQLLSQLNSTVFQFEELTSILYKFDGSCEAFWVWLQGSCHSIPRQQWEATTTVIDDP